MARRYELRWLRRHPVRFIRATWFHWAVAAALLVLAASRTGDIFVSRLVAPQLWPIVLGAVAGAVAVSSFAPLAPRVQAAVGAMLAGVSCSQLAVLAEALRVDAVSPQGRAVVWALLAHWSVMLAVAAAWPRMSAVAGLEVVIEAGHDDRGRSA